MAAQTLTRSPRRRDRVQRSACVLARHRMTKGKNVVVSCHLMRLPNKITHQQNQESSIEDP
jgi:hypothetical protein